MMVGPSGSGKSSAWRILLKALENVEGVEGVAHVVDPKVCFQITSCGDMFVTLLFTPLLKSQLYVQQPKIENDLLFSKWHMHNWKNSVWALVSQDEPKTFQLLVRTFYHGATGDSWELRPLN